MKKIYLIVILIVTSVFASAQIPLPYTYDFTGYFEQSGWTFQNNNENCLMNNVLSGQQSSGYGDNMWFISGYASCGSQYRQYLFSPRILNPTSDSIQFRFRYMIPDNQPTTETFVVGYCTAATFVSADDFLWLEDTVACTNTSQWLSYHCNLPSGTQYVAIAYTSGEQYALLIDDILLRANTSDVYYPFTVQTNNGGTVTVTTGGQTTTGSVSVAEADDLTYTVTPDPGYYISALYLDDIPNYGAVNQASFTQTISPVISAHVLRVTFTRIEYSIQIAAAEHGHIVPDGGEFHQLVVPWDTTVGFRFYPDEGYHVATVSLTSDGITTNYTDSPDTLTIANIRSNYSLYVSFELNDYTITASAGNGGSINPSGQVNVQAFASQQFLISANPGYLIDSLFVDSVAIAALNCSEYVYEFYEVIDNHTINVTFRHQPYIVTFSHTPYGSVTATGGVLVGLDSLRIFYEDTVRFDFVADNGYELSDIQLNEVSVGVANPYYLSQVTQNSQLYAVFGQKTFQVTVNTHGSGSVTPHQATSVSYYDTARFVISPNLCMQVDSILLDGVSIVPSDTVELTQLVGSHTLDVYFGELYYSIDYQSCEHGTIAGPVEVICGGTARLQLLPDNCYQVSQFLLDGEDRSDLLQHFNDTLWAVVPSIYADHTVGAVFEKLTYNVSVSTVGAGSVIPSAIGSVACDTSLSILIVPSECHYVSSVTVNGVDANPLLTHFPVSSNGLGDTVRLDLERINDDMSVSVEFSQFEFPLTLSAGEHGSLSVTGVLQQPCGTDTTILIVPDECYAIASVLVDGEDITQLLQFNGDNAFYTFSNVREPHSLEAAFERKSYIVGVYAEQNGSVLPANDSIVLCGDALNFLIVPDECYLIDTVWLDGEVINDRLSYRPNDNYRTGDSALYVLENITENHNLRASFKSYVYTVSAASFGNGTIVTDAENGTIECNGTVTVTMTPDDCYYLESVRLNGGLVTGYQIDENGVGTYVIEEAEGDLYISAIFERKQYSVTLAEQPEYGTINYQYPVYACGDTVRVTFVPEDCYHLDSVMIDDLWIPASNLTLVGENFIYDICDIRHDVLLGAVFSIDSVHFTSTEGATLSVTDSMLACGQNLTVYAVREDCHQLDSVRLNGVVYTDIHSVTEIFAESGDTLYAHFQNIHEDCELAVFYSHIQYEVMAWTQGHGTVSVPGQFTVACGDSLSVAIHPDDCHQLDSVTIQGQRYFMDNDSLLVIDDLRSDMELAFFFGTIRYEISVESNGNGNVSGPIGQVLCGSDLTYVFKANECYLLDSVFLDGVCVNDLLVYGQLPTLHIESVDANHNIRVVFKRILHEIEMETDFPDFVDVSPITEVECGNSYVINIATDTCHYITEVLLDGISVLTSADQKPHTFRFELPEVNQNHLVRVEFAKHSYSIDVAFMDPVGHILSSSHYPIECGSDTLLSTVYGDPCYGVDSVFVNGERVMLSDTVFFENVVSNTEMLVYVHRLTYTVTVLEHPHCEIDGDLVTQTLPCGASAHFEFIPDEGYYITYLIVDGDTLPAASYYDFANLDANHTLSVYTEQHTYMVIASDNGFGRVTPDTSVVTYGGSVSIYFYPDSCYEVTNVLLDGTSLGIIDSITLSEVVENHHVKVEFSRMQFEMEVLYEGLDETPATEYTLIDCGEDFVFRFVVKDCYAVRDVLVDNISRIDALQQSGNIADLTLSSIDDDHQIRILFEETTYTCSVTGSTGGTVISAIDTVFCGENWKCFILPDPCFHIAGLTVNGENVPVTHLVYTEDHYEYLLDSIYMDYSVAVSFERDTFDVVLENGDGGMVVLDNSRVLCGEAISFCVIPDTCSRLTSVKLNGVDITPHLTYRENANPSLADTACYEVAEVIENQLIEVSYEPESPHYIDVVFLSGTSVLARNDLSVSCGGDTVIPIGIDCYTLDSLTVDGVRVTETDSVVFQDVIDDHLVQAFFSRDFYRIVAQNGANGTIQPAGISMATCGGSRTYTIHPNQGYYIDGLIVDGDTIAPAGTYTFTNIRENHTIEPIFAVYVYPIEAEASEGGSITPGDTILPYGTSIRYDIVADDCYVIDSVLVNGENQGALSSYVFASVTAPQTIRAYFSYSSYSVASEVIGDGSVTLDATTVLCGENATVVAEAAFCAQLDSVVVNGTNIGAVTSYTIEDIRENQYVTAFFSPIVYAVEVDAAMEHGSISLSSSSVACGDSVTITVIPDSCYMVDSVVINGVNIGAVMDYTIANVETPQLITAYFSINEYTINVTSGEHGTVSLLGSYTVTCGDNFSVTISPDDCYEIGVVRLDGQWSNPLLVGNTLTLDNVTADHQISVDFALKRYYQRATCNLGGTVSPGFVAAACGSDETFEIELLNCYRIDTIWINGVVYPNDSLIYNGTTAHFTLHDIRQENTIIVHFAGLLYQFEVENNGDATVFLEQTSVDCDGEVTFYILPSQCERLQSVVLNGNDILSDIQYHQNANPLMPDTAFYTISRMDQDQYLQINCTQLPANHIAIVYTDGDEVVYQADSLLECGRSLSLPVSYECYTVDSVLLNGTNVGAVAFLPVTSNLTDQTVDVFISRNQYEVQSEITLGGSIMFDNGNVALCGDALQCAIVPDDCFIIDSVVVNGINQGAIESYSFENITDNQVIRAYFSRDVRLVTTHAGVGGSVLPQGTSRILCGDGLLCDIVPDECYSIDSVVVSGTNMGAISSYLFDNIIENQEVIAYFSRIEYSFNALAQQGGTIQPSGILPVACGEEITYFIAADDCQQIDSVVVNGVNVGPVTSYTLISSEENGNQSIIAYFSQREYPISLTAGIGGSVTPAEDTLISCNGSLIVEILPDECYSIETVFVDGNDLGAISSYTFDEVRESHSLSASFVRNEYVLTPTVTSGGSVSPNISTTVDCASDFTFSFSPNNGYYISAIVVDGDTIDAADSYTFTNVRGNHQIQPLFTLYRYQIQSTAGVGGTVTPEYALVDYLGRQTVEITANDCYHIDSVFVDGNYVGVFPFYTFNNVTADHTLAATFARDEYTVTATVIGNGTVTPSGTATVLCGESQTYTLTPDEGWHLSTLTVDGEPVPVATSYTFTDVREDHTLSAQFEPNEYMVTAIAGENGMVTPTDTTVIYGSSVTIEITAADCYHIDSVFVDGSYVGVGATYTFSEIATDHTLAATFARDEHTVTATVTGNGTVTPSGTTTVQCGESQTYTLTPDEGWHLSTLTVDGEPVPVATSYTFTDVREDHTLSAQFEPNEYMVTAIAGEGGMVTPTDTTVIYGSSVTVEITAADCYHIDSVFVDGSYVGVDATYTFSEIATDHTLAATFARDEHTVTATVTGNGTVTPSGTTTVQCGESQTYTLTPDEGWHLSTLTVDGEPVPIATSYTFTDVREDHTLSAQFEPNEYTVTAIAGEGGMVTPTDTTVIYGSSVTVEITAADCYHIDYVLVNGVNVGAEESIQLSDISENQMIEAYFVQDVYDVRVYVINENDTLLFDTIFNLTCDADTLITVPLFECYYVDSVSVNGILETNMDSVMLEDIREDMEVVFYLSREQYIIVASKEGNGTMTPIDTVYTACDEQVEFVFTPDEGWFVQNLIVDGESLGTPAENTYTFINIHSNHTIEVVFAPNVYIITSSIDPIDAGNITPYGETFVTHGEDQTFNIMPFPGYEVVDVVVDGVSQGAVTTYTFYQVAANHTIVAHLQVLGIDDNIAAKVNVWPNPVETACYVQIPEQSVAVGSELQLFDARGSLLLHKRVVDSTEVLDFTARPSGMYLIRIVSEGRTIVTKKVIRK